MFSEINWDRVAANLARLMQNHEDFVDLPEEFGAEGSSFPTDDADAAPLNSHDLTREWIVAHVLACRLGVDTGAVTEDIAQEILEVYLDVLQTKYGKPVLDALFSGAELSGLEVRGVDERIEFRDAAELDAFVEESTNFLSMTDPRFKFKGVNYTLMPSSSAQYAALVKELTTKKCGVYLSDVGESGYRLDFKNKDHHITDLFTPEEWDVLHQAVIDTFEKPAKSYLDPLVRACTRPMRKRFQ